LAFHARSFEDTTWPGPREARSIALCPRVFRATVSRHRRPLHVTNLRDAGDREITMRSGRLCAVSLCALAGLTTLASCQAPGGDRPALTGRAQALAGDGPMLDSFWLNQPEARPDGFGFAETHELGIRFRMTAAGTGGTIRGVRFYHPRPYWGTGRVSLWSDTGQLLAQATGMGLSSPVDEGWYEVQFPAPVPIEPGRTYTASRLANANVGFVYTIPYFTEGRSSGYLEAGPGAGVYGPDGSAPATVYSNANYWVDPVMVVPCATTPPVGPPVTVSLLGDTTTALQTSTDPTPVELGLKFRTNGISSVTGVRFYKSPDNVGTHVATLWDAAGNVLATATFANETASGWQTASFSAPVPVTAGQTYVASYFAPNGNWSYRLGGLGSGMGASTDLLYAPPAGAVDGNGVYRFGGGFPTGSYQGTHYFVDVVVVGSLLGCTHPPAQTGTTNLFGDVTPAVPAYSHDAPVELGLKFRTNGTRSVTGIRFYKGAGNDGPHTGSLWDAAGNLLASATFAGETASGWQTVSFSAPVPVTAGQTYVASYYAPVGHWAYEYEGLASGKGATTDPVYAPSDASAGGNAVYVFGGGFPSESAGGSHYFVDVVVTADGGSPPPPPPPPRTNVFGDVTPTIPAYNHDAPVELGLKFRTNGTRSVTGIRFYKGAGNDGPHTGSLWDAAGNLLAQATFAGETATGWQAVTFTSPVPVTAGQVYVASYYAPVGHWAYEPGGLASPRGATNGPVYAPSSASVGGNAVYVFGGGFPTESSGGSHYFVDVTVTP
jgi:hypothetical protein